MKVTKIPIKTEKYILELSREEAMVLKVIAGITSGSETKSYRCVMENLYAALSDLEWPEKNWMSNDLLECTNDSCGNKIFWKNGFISDSEFNNE